MHQSQHPRFGLMPTQVVIGSNKAIKQFNVLAHDFIITLDDCISFLHHKTSYLLIELRLTDTIVGFQMTNRFS